MNDHKEEVLEESTLDLSAELEHINARMAEEEAEVALAIVEPEEEEEVKEGE